MSNEDPIVIVSAKRTPMGHFNGCFKDVSSPQLGANALAAAIQTCNLSGKEIDEVIMGCVLSAGLGQAPARQAALGATIPVTVPCTTINKMCGSGMKAVMLGCDAIKANSADIVASGGMENMSRAPYLLPNARFGYRMGDQVVEDHMLLDGLLNADKQQDHMGMIAEKCADKYQLTREDQDAFACESVKRAVQAENKGLFKDEIAPISIQTKKGIELIEKDEGISKVNPDKIPKLKPAFLKDGTITAANASSISDGAAALILMRLSQAKKHNLKPLAKIIDYDTTADDPTWFTTAPITAIEILLKKINWQTDDVDLFEINEAFSVVTLAAMKALNLPHEKVNVHGGACVLGHPIGASGARILVTLIYALKHTKKKRGVAALCIGGGEATAIAIEVL